MLFHQQNVQVKVSGLQPRAYHSATSFSLSSGLTEVVIFGGTKDDIFDAKDLADTCLLQFSKCYLLVWELPPPKATRVRMREGEREREERT